MPPDRWPTIPLTGTDYCFGYSLSGVVNGAVAEINGILDLSTAALTARFGRAAGGRRRWLFSIAAHGSIFVVPELVLLGLNRILVHIIDYVEK